MTDTKSGRIPSLDGLRAVSIALVIAGHMLDQRGTAVGAIIASMGVHVFFVISGYLITRLLQQEYGREGRISLSGFYRRRVYRILPAAFTYIFLICTLLPGARSGLVYAVTYTVSYFFWSTPLALRHLWSLSIEEQFYLLWPLFLVLGFRHRAKIAIGAIVISAIYRLSVALGVITGPEWMLDAHFVLPGTMDTIAAGCLLAIYEPAVRKHLSWTADIGGLAIALPVVAFLLYMALLSGLLAVLWFVVPLTLTWWVFVLVERRDWLLNNPAVVIVGTLSYSLYLWQEPFTINTNHSILVTISATALCAVMSYLLVEAPMMRLGAITWQTERRVLHAG